MRGLHGILHICIMASRFVFLETLISGTGVAVTLLPALRSLSLILGCLNMRAFVLSCCILFCHVWILSRRGLFFSERKQREGGPGG